MAIKKGIVVLSGSTETHKFLDDGSGQLGFDGNQDITLNGTVFVEGLANDLVTEFSTQVSVQESASASLTSQMQTDEAASDTAWTTAKDSISVESTSLAGKINQEIADQGNDRAAFDADRATLSSTNSTRISNLSVAVSTQTSSRISAFDSLTTRWSAVDASLADMKVAGSSLFGKGQTYSAEITGMVQYAIDMDGTSDAAVLDAVNAKHQAVLNEQATRAQADTDKAGDIHLEDVAGIAAEGLLANQLSEIRVSASTDTQDAQSGESGMDSEVTARNTAIETADTSLSALLEAVDGTGHVSTRISADTSIQDDIDTATGEQSGDYTSLTDRLDDQIEAREDNISLREDQKEAHTNQNTADQTDAENSIIAEEGAQSTQDGTATNSLATRLVTEKGDFDSDESATRSADISLEISTRISVDTSMSTVLSTHVSTFTSEKSSLSTRLSNQTDDRVAKRNSLVSRLETDQTTINDMVGGVAFDGTLSHLVSFIDSVDTASDNAVITAIDGLSGSLSTQISLREDGDTSVQDDIDSETGTRTSQVGLKDAAFTAQATAHSGARKDAMLAATDTMFSELQSETIDTIANAAAAAITTEVGDASTAGTRIGDDTAKSGEVTAESGTDRPSAILSLQIARAGDASDGDVSLQTRITNLATTLPTDELTLVGTLDGASNVTVDGTMQIGRLTVADVPVSYLTPDNAHKGKMFYLDAPTGYLFAAAVEAVYDPATAPTEHASFMANFGEPQKWYFYEADAWHPMPFFHDEDGDGVRDQQDDYPNDPAQTTYVPPRTTQTVEALMDHDGWGNEIAFTIENITDGTTEFTHLGVYEASPADYVSLDVSELVQDKIYKYSVEDLGTWNDGTNYGADAVNPTIKLVAGPGLTNFGHDNGAGTMGIGIGNYGNPADPGNGTQFVYVMFDGTALTWGTTLNGAQDTITDGQSV